MNTNALKQRIEFWEYQHSIGNEKTLSNCPFEQVREGLVISNLLKPKMKILEIGVGTGQATKQMKKAGYHVSALDISLLALYNVRDYCDKTYTIHQLSELPSDFFDLIICCNVVQHTPTAVLQNEIAECMRALNSKGTFAIQFVSCGPVDDLGDVNSDLKELGCYGRSIHFMERLFAENDGVCSIMSSAKVKINPVTGSHVFHVTKLNKDV